MYSNLIAQLPTPPASPEPADAMQSDDMQSSLQLLDSLSSFYQHERYWTHHTRAALETALSSAFQGHVEATIGDGAPDDAHEPRVKKEPMSPRLKPVDGQGRRRSNTWNRRKNNLRLKLGGIEPPIRKQPTRPSQQILEMFAALIESRMESCDRVTAMVKNANRADLY